MLMARTTVDIDQEALGGARDQLGTSGLSETVNAALWDVARRGALADFDVVRDVDGTPDEVEMGRQARAENAHG